MLDKVRRINIFMFFKLFFIFFIFFMKFELKLAHGCPSDVCICKWKGGKQTVECGSQFLNELPEGMAQETQILNFSGNSLQILQSERFLRMDLINLQKIYLSKNQIIKIHEKSFRGLSNLVELDLSENLLQQVPSETFQDYTSLMRLALSSNPIRYLKSSSFRYLSFLTTLELSNCQIERIENEAFIGMDNLEWLRLDGNRINYIQGNHILPKALHGVSLQRNRWHCDCRLTDVHAWLINYNTPQSEEPKCLEPVRLKGQLIKFLKKDELACLPEVQPKSTYTEVFEGRNISIQCTVRAIPEPKVLWLFNGHVLTNDTVLENFHMFYYIDESYAEEKHSEVFIYNVGAEDNGTFSCTGQNTAGTTFSNYTVRVIIKEPPIVKEVHFPFKDYLNYITIIGGSVGALLVLILCIIVLKCTVYSINIKKCNENVSTNEAGILKSPSIIHDDQLSLTTSKASGIGSSGAVNGICVSNSNVATASKSVTGINAKHNQNMYVPSMQHSQLIANDTLHMYKTAADQIFSNKPYEVCNSYRVAAHYGAPPVSVRNNQDKNPDLVNDAELVKSKMRRRNDFETNEILADSQYKLHDKKKVSAGTNSGEELFDKLDSHIIGLQHDHTSNLYNQRKLAAISTVHHDIQLKSSIDNQYQVDVHLNPVRYLSQDRYGYDFSDVHLHNNNGENSLSNHTNQLHNFYRTLPHKRGHTKLYPAKPSNDCANTGYTIQTEYLERPGTPIYEKYVQNMRFTAEGYPVHPSAALAAIVQYPSTPEGYQADGLPEDSTNVCNSLQSMCSGVGSFQQWPPSLPGYKVQTSQCSTSSPVELACGFKQYSNIIQSQHSPLSKDNYMKSTSSKTQTLQSTTINLETKNDKFNKLCKKPQTSESVQSTIPECETPMQTSKLRHLTGPLADSPDEGYVGDSQEGSDV